MKKLALACLITLFAAAVVPPALEAGVGLKGGLTWASLAITSADPVPFSFGKLPFYAGGVYFDLGLGFVSIQPELLYVRMGAAYEVDELNSLEFRHHYIQAPVLLRFNIIPAGPVRPFLCGGGYGAYLIKSEGVMEIDGATEKTDVTDEYVRFDYGLVGGAGIMFKLGIVGLSVEGRYTYGLANIVKDAPAGDAIKNRSLMALVGIKF